ncbi:MAG: PQQ-binding-like beta-propeller repeat protein [Planctomycetota bacterium]|nr:PQQ-binding-like beta-propeller repeat protein [Planctomycetota bacterium]
MATTGTVAGRRRRTVAVAISIAVFAAAAEGVIVALWLSGWGAADSGIAERVPLDTDFPKSDAAGGTAAGRLTAGPGKPSAIRGSWPQFRGPDRSNVAPDSEKLPPTLSKETVRIVWSLEVGEGHAGAAVAEGCVYLIDYDRDRQEDAIRCLSLDDGREIWRYSYPARVKRNHGMSRTVPAVANGFLVGIGPLCHVTCLEAATGKPRWALDLVRDFGATVPQWYAGQCALIDGGAAIIAPGGDGALMMAVELESGKIRWKTPNPGGWKMSHVSIMPMDRRGGRQYLYGTARGVVGVSASDGRILWRYEDWKMSTPVASPLPIDQDRIFLAGGYGFGGCAMIRLAGGPPDMRVEEIFRLGQDAFGSEQHTAVLYEGHLYGILCRQAVKGGELACLALDGKVRWTSGRSRRFGLGPFMIADGKILALEDNTGMLRMFAADPAGCREFGSLKVLDGHDAWAPMALADGRLLLRDSTRLVCLDVSVGR